MSSSDRAAAGWTAALYTARAQLAPLVLTGKQPGGLLTTTSIVENFPGFPEGVDGYELMTRMQKQAERFGAKTSFGVVEAVDFSKQPFALTVDGEKVEAETVIIATGASHKHLGVPGEDLLETKGVTYCATCDGALPVFRNQPLVVVGGGDSACEEALYLTRFGSVVYLVHRRDSLRASKIMAGTRSRAHKDQADLGFRRDGNSRREAGQSDRREIEKSQDRRGIAFWIARASSSPSAMCRTRNCSKARSTTDANGFIVPQNGTMTNVPGVFVAGDCADHVYRQAITAAGAGCAAAIDAERFLAARNE